MKKFSLFLSFLFVIALTPAVAGDTSCAALTIAPLIEVPPGDFTAADLLPPDACPWLVKSAARIHLGRAPLKGIPRVFDAGEIHSILVRALSLSNEGQGARRIDPSRALRVPERVIVRRTRTTHGSEIVAGTGKSKSAESSGTPTMRPGQTATLVWDADGIRVAVPVTCLDRGATGDSVRARIAPSGTIVRAVVVEAGILRVTL